MILDFLLGFFDRMSFSFVDWVPSFGMPGFWTQYIPQIFDRIMDFNDYLPIIEAIQTVVFCLVCTLTWKLAKVILGIVNIHLGA